MKFTGAPLTVSRCGVSEFLRTNGAPPGSRPRYCYEYMIRANALHNKAVLEHFSDTANSHRTGDYPSFVSFEGVSGSSGSKSRDMNYWAAGADLVALSPNITVETSTINGAAQGTLRLLARDSYFYNKFTSKDGEGSVYLSSRRNKKFTVVHVDGSSVYFSQAKVVAAAAPGIILEGPLALSTSATLHKITLEEGERMLVDPNRLVLWDSLIDIDYSEAQIGGKEVERSQLSRSLSSATRQLSGYTSKLVARFIPKSICSYFSTALYLQKLLLIFKRILCYIVRGARAALKPVSSFFKSNLYGYPNKAYSLKGPGTLYVKTGYQSTQNFRR